MLTTEQVKKIAEYLGLPIISSINEIVIDYCWGESVYEPSENDEENHKVFKALVDECGKRCLKMEICNKILIIKDIHVEKEHLIFVEILTNESICLAFLSVMESK